MNSMGKLVASTVPLRISGHDTLASLAIAVEASLASTFCLASSGVGTNCILMATSISVFTRVDALASLSRGGLLEITGPA